MSDPDAARLRTLIRGFAGQRVVVAGDLMLDEFVWGRVTRISPEAPVPVVSVTGESYYPGGAANVARNLRDLGAEVSVAGTAGDDPAGRRLVELLTAAGVDTSGILLDSAFSTTLKTRVIARNQQVVRVDRERPAPLPEAAAARAAEWLDHAMGEARALVVADYGKGFLSQPLADFLCGAARRRGVILTVDPHPHTSLTWRGVTAVKPNRAEAFLAAGLPPSEPVTPVAADRTLLEAGNRLLELWQPGCLLITLGEHGMLLFEASAEPWHIPTCARDVFDVSGAGDTAIAAFTLGLAAGASPREASTLANRASGIAVGKLGTATVTISELAQY